MLKIEEKIKREALNTDNHGSVIKVLNCSPTDSFPRDK